MACQSGLVIQRFDSDLLGTTGLVERALGQDSLASLPGSATCFFCVSPSAYPVLHQQSGDSPVLPLKGLVRPNSMNDCEMYQCHGDKGTKLLP